MEFLSKMIRLPLFLFAGLLVFSSCEEDQVGKGTVELKLTDAPVDDASIQGVFITIASVQVGDASLGGEAFSSQTINLLDYQEGNTFALATGELDAASYNQLIFELNLSQDEDGNSPGCYVLDADGNKLDLKGNLSNSLEVKAPLNLKLDQGETQTLIADFDLRKALIYEGDEGAADRGFQFASAASLNNSIRTVNAETAGSISGTFSPGLTEDPDKVIVYLYQEGDFTKASEETETFDDVRFQGAVTSTVATRNGGVFAYEFAYLEPGDYELCLVALKEESNGSYDFTGYLQSTLSLNSEVVTPVKVDASASVVLNLMISGLVN